MQDLHIFYKNITEWLFPLGFVEIYQNHPNTEIREFHFIKDGVRVCCVNAWNPYCYLQNDVLGLTPHVSLRSGQHIIGFENVQELVNIMVEQENKLKL